MYPLIFLCLLVLYASAQSVLSPKVPPAKLNHPKKDTVKSTPPRVNPKLIRLEFAKVVYQSEHLDHQVLKDSVILYHEGAYLYCDSAYYNEKLNTFEAFSNVRMVQGDTIFLYGKYMHYDGMTKLAKVRQNVRLENVPQNVTLFTDSLDYDRQLNIGYYFDGGMLVDTLNELTSYWGQYEPNRKLALFLDSVKLVNPNFVLYSDTLRYHTDTKTAYITSPTRIVSDSGIIYTKNGNYNTEKDFANLYDQSSIVNKKGDRTMRGDTLFYNKAAGYGEAFHNMSLVDTTKRVILRGHYGFYNELTDFALARDSAYCTDYSQGDSLFMHGDTLTMAMDSIYRVVKAYHNARFYRSDMQGVCDSMQFNSRNSVLHMFKDPILWNTTNQLSGDTIDIFMNDSTIDYVHVKRYSFSIEQKDSIHYNQLKGRSLKAFFENKAIKRVLVEGNAESVFYPEENDKSLVGLNWLESGYMDIRIKYGQMERLTAWPKPRGSLTPLDLTTEDQLKLKDFYWYDYLRPLSKDDIFRKVSKKTEDIPVKKSSNLFKD